MNYIHKIVGVLAISALLFGVTAHAVPTLTEGLKQRTGNGNSTARTLISVTPGSEGYSEGASGGNLTGTFDGTILDYAFFAAGDMDGVPNYAGSGTQLSDVTADAWTTFGGNYCWLWDATAPDVTLSNPDRTNLQTRGLNITGTVNISGMSAGYLYFFYGCNKATATVDLTMSGTGQTDVVLTGAGSFTAGSNVHGMVRVDFADAAAYDTITWTYRISTNAASNSRFAGLALVEPGADTTAPAWASGPTADTETLDGFTVRGAINEAGTAYYVVLADGAPAPSSAQVIAGTDASNVAATNGNFALAAATEGTDAVTGLSASTAYDVYVVAQDDEGTPNVQAAPVLVNVTTLTPDSTDPVWALDYPKADTQTADGFTARARIDEAGTAYYVVLADGATAPTSAEVKAGTGNGGAVALASGSIIDLVADTEGSDVVTGLTYSPGISFDVYFVAEDIQSNIQDSPVLVDWTPDTTAPTWTATYPLVDTPTEEGFTVRASIVGEAGTAYYVVLDDAATAPSAAQIKAGTDADDLAALTSGNFSLTADTEGAVVVTGLAALTDYDVYIVAEDTSFNLTTPVPRDVATTAADVTMPTWTSSYPLVDTVTSSGFTVRASIDEAGTAYYVVVADGSTPAPDAAQIKAGTDGSDVAALASGSFSLAASTENSEVVIGLADDTAYDIYIVAEDNAVALNTTAVEFREATTPVSALTVVGNVQWNDNAARTVSVFAGNSFIQATLGNGTLPDVAVSKDLGTVVGYNLFNESTVTDNTIASYANLGTRIAVPTTTDTDGINSSTLIATAVYTTNDPAAGTPTPNFTSNTHVNAVHGSVDGSIDVTGLTAGTLYFIIGNGSNADGRQTSLTVSTGSSTVVTAQSGGGYYQAGGTGFWANADTISACVEISFTNDGSNNTISYSWDQTSAGRFLGVVLSTTGGGGETFAEWISDYPGVGVKTGLDDDPDGDGNGNGVEAFFGTDPGTFTAGLTSGVLTTGGSNTFTFTHPQSGTLPSDLAAAYQWTADLTSGFNADGATVVGTTVNFSASTDDPVAGTTTVTATITGTIPDRLFVKVLVTQP